MKFGVILVIISIMLGWTGTSGAAQKVCVNSEFQLKAGAKAGVRDTGLTIRFLAVSEDSRCPEGVNCIWAGNGKVKISVSAPKKPAATLELNTTTTPSSASYEGYDIKLVKLAPYPKHGTEIKPADYVVTLLVTKKAVASSQ